VISAARPSLASVAKRRSMRVVMARGVAQGGGKGNV
jgi:hypothetical protein